LGAYLERVVALLLLVSEVSGRAGQAKVVVARENENVVRAAVALATECGLPVLVSVSVALHNS
jgi:hypothetical protein